MNVPSFIPQRFADLHVETPSIVAARRVLDAGMRLVDKAIEALLSSEPVDRQSVRRLRVATRRADGALELFELFCGRRRHRAAKRKLRGIRRAMAPVRRTEVLIDRLSADHVAETPAESSNILEMLRDLQGQYERRRNRSLTWLVRSDALRRWRRLRRKLIRGVDPERIASRVRSRCAPEVNPYTLGELAAVELPELSAAVRRLQDEELTGVEDLHRLRIANKRLRYACEIFSNCFPAAYIQDMAPVLEQAQDRLGEINDLHEIAVDIGAIVAVYANDPHPARSNGDHKAASGACALESQYRTLCEQRVRAFIDWWHSPVARAGYQSLAAMIQQTCIDWASLVRSRRNPGNLTPLRSELAAGSDGSREMPPVHRRVAAIDVGTNSIRLTVAETDPEHGFRVIEDVKETTRLGSGVYTEGRLKSGAMERSVSVLERMRNVAEGHHVDRLRAIGTSAIREAGNSHDFVDVVRRRAGVHIEIIDAEREARLALSSVARSFDLADCRIAVADLGGGSTELVFGAGGVVDAVFPLPLGAVRLTECYLSGEDREQRYEQMVYAIDGILLEALGQPVYTPELLIGTGGTFTSLARVAILRGGKTEGSGRFPFAVRGYELQREQIGDLLGWLRGMSIDERRAVAGLSSQRAEIIVAGVCVIERVMRYLRVDRLRIHDGGIRDGLLAEMIDDLRFDPRPARRGKMDVVHVARTFAEHCKYDREHSEHVAALCVQIFNQLAIHAPDSGFTWTRREFRELLQAAAIVHDVGILIGLARHNRHGYEMIVHGQLPGLSRREIEMLACAARYHRGGGPRRRHPNFQRLGDEDQRLVMHLIGVLRIADGLDRLHAQNVVGVRLESEPGFIRFVIDAPELPAVNLFHARRKADVFEKSFHVATDFGWQPRSAAVATSQGVP